jgi:hypothetical protein
MSSLTEAAVKTYIHLAGERNAGVREALIEKCWAVDGRLISPNGGFCGRAALSEMIARFVGGSEWVRIRVVALDVRGAIFRLRGFTDLRDGRSLEVSDVGEVDASGRISLLFTFPGPLVEAAHFTVER